MCILLYFHTGNYYNSSLGIIIIADSDNVIFVHMVLEFFLHTGSFDFRTARVMLGLVFFSYVANFIGFILMHWSFVDKFDNTQCHNIRNTVAKLS